MGATELTMFEAFSERMAQIRTDRVWSAQALSDRLTEIGYPMSRSTLSKIESRAGRQSVTIDEAVAIAIALEVPLPLLLTPVARPDDLRVTESITVEPWVFYAWMVGDGLTIGPPPGADQGGSRWQVNQTPASLYRKLRPTHREVQLARGAIRAADRRGDHDHVKRHERLATAYRNLFELMAQLASFGWSIEGLLTEEQMNEAEALGVTPEEVV